MTPSDQVAQPSSDQVAQPSSDRVAEPSSDRVAQPYRVLRRWDRFSGPVFTVVSDEVAMPGGGSAVRDFMRHVGAAAVVAVDDSDRVVLVRQYRHPVGHVLWELPAGLLDAAGETPLGTATRELAEEADLVAATWNLLVELHPSPGYSNEFITVFLARGLSPVPDDARHVREHEEADMVVERVGLGEAVGMIFRGEITNATAVAGILAASRAFDLGWAPLRPS